MIGQGLGRVAQAEKLSIQQLEEALENRTIPAYIGIPLLEEKVQIEQRMKIVEMEQKGGIDLTRFYKKPDDTEPPAFTDDVGMR